MTSGHVGYAVPNWKDACARLQRAVIREKHQQVFQQENIPFSERELARLAFVRWRCQTGRLDSANTLTRS